MFVQGGLVFKGSVQQSVQQSAPTRSSKTESNQPKPTNNRPNRIQDTFLDYDHLVESFPQYAVQLKGEARGCLTGQTLASSLVKRRLSTL